MNLNRIVVDCSSGVSRVEAVSSADAASLRELREAFVEEPAPALAVSVTSAARAAIDAGSSPADVVRAVLDALES